MNDETSDALEMLKSDHRTVDSLFREYEELVEDDADADARKSVAQSICVELTIHTQIEEELFYPAARDLLDELGLLDEAEVEHASAKELIAQIDEMSAEDDLFDAKVKVLGEQIAHHVDDEEGALFPKLRDAGMDTEALGRQMSDLRQEIMEEMGLFELQDED